MIWIADQNELNMIEQGRGIVSVGVLVCGRACTSSHHFVTFSGGLKTIHWQQPTVNSKQSIDEYRFHRKKNYNTYSCNIHLHDYNFQNLRSQIATRLIVL